MGRYTQRFPDDALGFCDASMVFSPGVHNLEYREHHANPDCSSKVYQDHVRENKVEEVFLIKGGQRYQV